MGERSRRLIGDSRAGGNECVLSDTSVLGSMAGAGSAGVGAAGCGYSGADDFLFDICGSASAALRAGMFPGDYRAGCAAIRAGAAESAFFDRLGMNREAENLRKAFFHTIFECGGNVVDLGDGKAAVHRAMARDQDLVIDAADVNFVAIKQFVVFRLK